MKPPIYEPKGKAKEYGDLALFSVYIHTFPNGKKYVGISKDIKRRFRNGKGYQNQPIIWSAIEKYGWENVSTQIVQQGLSEEDAKSMEVDLIASLKTTDREFGYNQTLGGEGATGRVVSEKNRKDTGERMSRIHKGVPLSEEHKGKISVSLKGRPKQYSQEGHQRIVESNRTRAYSKETREKISTNTRIAMAEKNMGAYLSQKWKAEKEKRKAKLRVTMYSRYGVIPKRYDLREDILSLGLSPNDYPELFQEQMEEAT